jgi:alcohol dehydrogenase
MAPFEFNPRTRVLCGPGRLAELGGLAASLGATRVLLVTDSGLLAAGHPQRAEALLRAASLSVERFSDFSPNPTSADAEKARAFAAPFQPDLLVAIGGGSALDLAKAAAVLLANGGDMRDYQGYARLARPALPTLAIPASTGTGSEAQSYCVISDPQTRRKMACGDPSAAPRLALLDPEVALSQPFATRAASGFDALIHAVETTVTTRATPLSALLSAAAWRLLSAHYLRCLAEPGDIETVGAMQWGAHLAGWAIENSMLGATHACANPLTQRYGLTHGHALSILAPHVVEFNRDPRYAALDPELAVRLREFARAARLPATLRDAGVPESDLPPLAELAATYWTGRFNPRHFDASAALEIYRCAF